MLTACGCEAEFRRLRHRQPATEEREKLAEEFGVARMTIRKAIDLLVDWGLVVASPRLGNLRGA
ncbi:GntR family transcriptional regulator [Klebsiella pneumoniae subsp. pneumoniae]|nr:GntR family transcriptional regulator [Klebsiella pneumoniae subsp. pneumoniae]